VGIRDKPNKGRVIMPSRAQTPAAISAPRSRHENRWNAAS
jgi:hypothetical protein